MKSIIASAVASIAMMAPAEAAPCRQVIQTTGQSRIVVRVPVAVPVGIPVGAYGTVGYRTNYGQQQTPYSAGSPQGAYGSSYGVGLTDDERVLDAILSRLAAAEAATASLRAKLVAAGGLVPAGAQSPVTPAAASNAGIEVLRTKCATCHRPGGKGADALEMVNAEGAWVPGLIDHRAGLVDAVLSGKMPKNGELTDNELRALLGFLYQNEE